MTREEFLKEIKNRVRIALNALNDVEVNSLTSLKIVTELHKIVSLFTEYKNQDNEAYLNDIDAAINNVLIVFNDIKFKFGVIGEFQSNLISVKKLVKDYLNKDDKIDPDALSVESLIKISDEANEKDMTKEDIELKVKELNEQLQAIKIQERNNRFIEISKYLTNLLKSGDYQITYASKELYGNNILFDLRLWKSEDVNQMN